MKMPYPPELIDADPYKSTYRVLFTSTNEKKYCSDKFQRQQGVRRRFVSAETIFPYAMTAQKNVQKKPKQNVLGE